MRKLVFGVGAIVCALPACSGADDSILFQDAAVTQDVVVETGPPPLTKSGKLDMLFAIDNSASMGDKQELLVQAIPQFLDRLSAPWCVSKTDPNAAAVPANAGVCESGFALEFAPIKDIHIGIVSSSLGGGGSPDICVPAASDTTHQDDRGHLLNRTRPANAGDAEGSVAAAAPLDGNGGNFLAWVPGGEKVNVTNEPSVSQLETDFSSLVVGVNEHGCGLEAQLESWYRFLVQPDPYDHIALSSDVPPRASLVGIDATVLKQRHDFLRPDSLLLVAQITDEDDSWSDPLWLDGYGWTVRTFNFPGGPSGVGVGPRGTSECDTNASNPDCVSCAFGGQNKPVAKTPISADPNCNACAGGTSSCAQKGWYTAAATTVPYAAADGLNVRYTDSMRARYGLDPQWSVQRYVDGVSSKQVPDRSHEIHDSAQYATTQKNCTNPIFAASLPDGSDLSAAALCSMPLGNRDPSLVYFLIIGGVPWQLLAQDPFNPALPLKSTLDAADWRRIVGNDPSKFDTSGIDPHMIESIAPRAGLPDPTSASTADPINGREWNTLESNAGIDLQFACVFDLAQPKDCTDQTISCDCTGNAVNADGPPLCDTTTPTMQIRGKAYPTIRELRVAKGLGNQGVVASICPRVNAASYFEALFSRIRASVPSSSSN
ncbi:MAG TPA: hypothetical protein VGH87_05280 [Polyangiaceae bacterium]